jgi:hypothetical protein
MRKAHVLYQFYVYQGLAEFYVTLKGLNIFSLFEATCFEQLHRSPHL